MEDSLDEGTFAAENNDRLTKRDREFDETMETDERGKGGLTNLAELLEN